MTLPAAAVAKLYGSWPPRELTGSLDSYAKLSARGGRWTGELDPGLLAVYRKPR